jgi:hypothetical protein
MPPTVPLTSLSSVGILQVGRHRRVIKTEAEFVASGSDITKRGSSRNILHVTDLELRVE